MNWEDERLAFERRVQDNFNTCPVQFPGDLLKPPAEGNWVRMSLLPGTSQRITLGPNYVVRETGTLLFMIFGPGDEGSTEIRQIADELSNLFNEAIFSHNNSGRIRCLSPVLQTRGPTPDNTWYQLNLLVNYERDVQLA